MFYTSNLWQVFVRCAMNPSTFVSFLVIFRALEGNLLHTEYSLSLASLKSKAQQHISSVTEEVLFKGLVPPLRNRLRVASNQAASPLGSTTARYCLLFGSAAAVPIRHKDLRSAQQGAAWESISTLYDEAAQRAACAPIRHTDLRSLRSAQQAAWENTHALNIAYPI